MGLQQHAYTIVERRVELALLNFGALLQSVVDKLGEQFGDGVLLLNCVNILINRHATNTNQ